MLLHQRNPHPFNISWTHDLTFPAHLFSNLLSKSNYQVKQDELGNILRTQRNLKSMKLQHFSNFYKQV